MRIRLAAAIALVAGAALAQPSGGFTQLFMSPCGEPFRANDGEPYPLNAWFAQADTNHDGALDPEEFRADHARFFAILDQDKNGFIDGIEVSFYEKRIAPDVLLGQLIGARDPARTPPGLWGGTVIKAQLGTLGGGGYQAPGGAQGPAPDLGATRRPKQVLIGSEVYGLLKDPEPVTSADSNLDGRITRAEFLAAADRRFKRLDRNGDGRITLDELPKPQAQVVAEEAARKRAKKR